MTYAELASMIANMTDEQKSMTVTVYIEDKDEYFGMNELATSQHDNDVLDSDHPYLVI